MSVNTNSKSSWTGRVSVMAKIPYVDPETGAEKTEELMLVGFSRVKQEYGNPASSIGLNMAFLEGAVKPEHVELQPETIAVTGRQEEQQVSAETQAKYQTLLAKHGMGETVEASQFVD